MQVIKGRPRAAFPFGNDINGTAVMNRKTAGECGAFPAAATLLRQ